VTENGSTLRTCAAAKFLCFCTIFSISHSKMTFFIQSSPYLGTSLIAQLYVTVTVYFFDETRNRLLIRRASNFRFCKGPRNKLVQNHTKQLLIGKISDPFKEIVVAESNGRSVREYVFFIFSDFKKKHDFLRFFEMTLKKT